MSDKKLTNTYDDGNIPDIDLPQDSTENELKDSTQLKDNTESSLKSSQSKKMIKERINLLFPIQYYILRLVLLRTYQS